MTYISTWLVMEYQSFLIFKLLCLSLKWANSDIFLEKVYIQEICFEISNLTWKSKGWIGFQETGTKNHFSWQMGALRELKIIKQKTKTSKILLKLLLDFFFFLFSINGSPYVIIKKTIFISSKKLFSISRYSNISIYIFPSFFPAGHCFRGWLKINRKVYHVINCLNKNS